MIKKIQILVLSLFISSLYVSIPCAMAQQKHVIDWDKLNLNPTQKQTIDSLNKQWLKDYKETNQLIVEDEQKLKYLLSPNHHNAAKIMLYQQNLAMHKQKLKSIAMSNYLQKREVLNQTQKNEVDKMLSQALSQSKRVDDSSSQDESSDRLQNLIKRVKNSGY